MQLWSPSNRANVLKIGLALGLVWSLPGAAAAQEEEPDPAEVVIGERLFLETRFAQFFGQVLADAPGTSVNDPLPIGDSVMDTTRTPNGALPGPFAGSSMNCRQCHQVDEQLDEAGGSMRTYSDFARRSPVPFRAEDDLEVTARNSPSLVNASLPRESGVLVHFDAEFTSLSDLVKGTIRGRNYGYLPLEGDTAVELVARVVREDDGSGGLADEFGATAYRDILQGAESVPGEFQLPQRFRVEDVDAATDTALFDTVSRLIAAYVEQLEFEHTSPFDRFLEANGLPTAPKAGESAEHYTKRLRRKIKRLRKPVFIDDGLFEFHDQNRVFGPEELEGLRIFVAEKPGHSKKGRKRSPSGIGNCSSCHPAPFFTDFGFHNTGISQDEYDEIHGSGRFANLGIPGLDERLRDPKPWLPATERTPDAEEPFRRPAVADEPLHTDLGLWNIWANPDFPATQHKIQSVLCEQALGEAPRRALRSPVRRFWTRLLLCNEDHLLEQSLAAFKTPSLRDLGHSAPYFHNGSIDDLGGVVRFYKETSELSRDGATRNPSPELQRIFLGEKDIEPLIRFLRSLNEDYS